MIETSDIILIVCAWMLIPLAILLKKYLDGRCRKTWEETRPAIEKWLKGCLGKDYCPVKHRVLTYDEEMERLK